MPRWWTTAEKKDEGSYHGVRLSSLASNVLSIAIHILSLFSSQCDMLFRNIQTKPFFDDIFPQQTHHVDEVVASHRCGAEGQVLASDVPL